MLRQTNAPARPRPPSSPPHGPPSVPGHRDRLELEQDEPVEHEEDPRREDPSDAPADALFAVARVLGPAEGLPDGREELPAEEHHADDEEQDEPTPSAPDHHHEPPSVLRLRIAEIRRARARRRGWSCRSSCLVVGVRRVRRDGGALPPQRPLVAVHLAGAVVVLLGLRPAASTSGFRDEVPVPLRMLGRPAARLDDGVGALVLDGA